jgi:biotin carboxyl carrier protein
MKTYYIRVDGQVYHVSVADLNSNPVLVTVDGEEIEVWVENEPAEPARSTDHPIGSLEPGRQSGSQPGSLKTTNGNDRLVKAPIPGVITAIQVQPGQAVQVGDILCSLEAMKMVNSIRAARSGTIGAIHVSLGQHVRHQELLLEYAEQDR